VRCSRCGNENLDANRFCGMCGATLLAAAPASSTTAQGTPQATVPAASAPSPVPSPPARAQAPAPSRTTAPVSEYSPGISGPSFLGLNDPAPRKRASLSTDSHSSSGNLDYLLEDEEEPRRGGAGKFVLILLALALAGGFGYLRWKNQKFGWLGAGTNKPTAAAQNSDTGDTNAATPAGSSALSTPATTPSIQPATDAAAPVPASANTGSTNTSGTNPGSPAAATTTNPATGGTPASMAPATADSAPPSTTYPAAAAPAASAPDTPAATTPKPAKPADVPQPKPAAAIKPAKPFDPVAEAQKYIYGKGVPQDCERGMRILKPAVNQSNPKAMIEMGALYSAGLCTPHDLPTAYRWFALALRKEPDNQAVQTDLQKLWGEMTQPERQLAIKLSH
jgi:hypothetical protein